MCCICRVFLFVFQYTTVNSTVSGHRQFRVTFAFFWIVPQFLNLRPKNGEIYCICDYAYHKQEPCFSLFKLGQIVILP